MNKQHKKEGRSPKFIPKVLFGSLAVLTFLFWAWLLIDLLSYQSHHPCYTWDYECLQAFTWSYRFGTSTVITLYIFGPVWVAVWLIYLLLKRATKNRDSTSHT